MRQKGKFGSFTSISEGSVFSGELMHGDILPVISVK
jgi:hypothetical protein